MRKLTRKQAEKLLENKFECVKNSGRFHRIPSVPGLCYGLPCELSEDFRAYWKKVNTRCNWLMDDYFPHDYTTFEASFLRLLSAHLFIRDTYK